MTSPELPPPSRPPSPPGAIAPSGAGELVAVAAKSLSPGRGPVSDCSSDGPSSPMGPPTGPKAVSPAASASSAASPSAAGGSLGSSVAASVSSRADGTIVARAAVATADGAGARLQIALNHTALNAVAISVDAQARAAKKSRFASAFAG
eukprot:1717042-Pyramimonas_sp.AAC.1